MGGARRNKHANELSEEKWNQKANKLMEKVVGWLKQVSFGVNGVSCVEGWQGREVAMR